MKGSEEEDKSFKINLVVINMHAKDTYEQTSE